MHLHQKYNLIEGLECRFVNLTVQGGQCGVAARLMMPTIHRSTIAPITDVMRLHDDAARGDAYQTEEPAAEHAADYPYHEIHYKAEATSAHEFAGNESGYDSDDYVPDKSHDVSVL